MKTIDKFLVEDKIQHLREMKVYLGDDPDATNKSWQAEFPHETDCCKCDGRARLAFVAHEGSEEKDIMADMHENMKSFGGAAWPHDNVAVAVYFCKKCLETTALYNQA